MDIVVLFKTVRVYSLTIVQEWRMYKCPCYFIPRGTALKQTLGSGPISSNVKGKVVLFCCFRNTQI